MCVKYHFTNFTCDTNIGEKFLMSNKIYKILETSSEQLTEHIQEIVQRKRGLSPFSILQQYFFLSVPNYNCILYPVTICICLGERLVSDLKVLRACFVKTGKSILPFPMCSSGSSLWVHYHMAGVGLRSFRNDYSSASFPPLDPPHHPLKDFIKKDKGQHARL